VRSHLLKVPQAQTERPFDEAGHAEPELGCIQHRDLKMISNVKPRVRHDDAAEEARNRGLAVERVRPMYDEAGGDCLLTCFFRIEGRHVLAGRQRRCAATTGDDASAGRRRVDVQAAGHLERRHELAHAALVASLDDQIEGVFPLYDRFTLNLDAVLPHVRPAEMIEEHRPDVRVLGGTAFGCVLMPDNEQRHGVCLLVVSVSRYRVSVFACPAISALSRCWNSG
jgi:hypothetical protein